MVENLVSLKMPIVAEPYLRLSTQCMVVQSGDWSSVSAEMQLWERKNFTSGWIKVKDLEVVTGKNGWAWGRGIHPDIEDEDEPHKQEGDNKTPVGVFTLGKAFGYEKGKQRFSWPYMVVTKEHKAVDDPKSSLYNQIIEQNKVSSRDWGSAEDMLREDGLYKYGLIICHNTKNIRKGAGSCIFMHLWRGSGQGTEGCTAMGEEDMLYLLHWLRPGANPILFQGPHGVFEFPF